MKKYIFLLTFFLFFIYGCNQNEVIKTHGVAYLNKREKLLVVNETNKNDTVSILGQPSTKGMVDDNLWIYIERTRTRGKMLKLGRNYLKKNKIKIDIVSDNSLVIPEYIINLKNKSKKTLEKIESIIRLKNLNSKNNHIEKNIAIQKKKKFYKKIYKKKKIK